MSHQLVRGALAVALLVAGLVPVTAVTASPLPDPAPAPAPAAALAQASDTLDPAGPRAGRFIDADAKVSFTPPQGWVAAPHTSLNPPSAPASPVYELVRYQLRVRDAALYAQPIPLTSGVIADAGAVISVGLAREESELLDLDMDPRAAREELTAQGGFSTFDESATYEGLVVYTRYFLARDSDRRLVMQAVASTEDWPLIESAVMSSLRSLRADQIGPHGPVAPAPAPPPPPPAPEAVQPPANPDAEARLEILTRAKALLGTPYVWGGNSPNRSMDCSSYVSWAWGVARYSTDSLWQVSHEIGKEDLRPGDAMNLTTGRDPQRYGHIRIFEAWANEAHTLVWVYEETPPRAVHRVIAYDARYQPIRLNGLSSAGPVPLVVAPASAVEPTLTNYGPAAAPRQPRATPRPAVRATPRPATPRPTVRPTVRATVRPSATVRPTVRPSASVRPTIRPSATVRVQTLTPRPLTTPRPAATAAPTNR